MIFGIGGESLAGTTAMISQNLKLNSGDSVTNTCENVINFPSMIFIIFMFIFMWLLGVWCGADIKNK